MLEVIGFIGAILIGISLGLMGSGGSILTVPLLVYVFKMDSVTATSYSLFIVGASSLVGAFPKWVKGEARFINVLGFGLPSIISVYYTRKVLVPKIPDTILHSDSFHFSKDKFILILFALFMVIAAISMIRDKKPDEQKNGKLGLKGIIILILEGVFVGIMTGLVGAGGGFLILPVLVLFVGLPMKEAVITSLSIIALKSLIGFWGDVQNHPSSIRWDFLLTLTSISVVGIFIGYYLSRFFSGRSLKKGFGWFVLLVGILIFLFETMK